jgi:RHS repeat-associated protein
VFAFLCLAVTKALNTLAVATKKDKNGNIKTLQRFELGAAIDNLTYTYEGNRLIKIEDAAAATTGFKNAVNTTNEYWYDANGSMYKDDNKGITNTTYNHLNLPVVLTTAKGTITYTYDATGNKLKKTTYETAINKTVNTFYAGGMVYTEDEPQLIMQDEGRIRPVKINTAQPFTAANLKYVYDYFLKDHLGNTRAVVTEETQTFIYAATMEPANATVENDAFMNVSTTGFNKPAGFDSDGTNTRVSRLHGNVSVTTNKRIGPGKVLKVMAGDIISISVRTWYTMPVNTIPASAPPIANELVNALTAGLLGVGGGKDGLFTSTTVQPLSANAVNNLINTRTVDPSRPKAFLQWMILDENFNYTGTSSFRSAMQVPNITSGNSVQIVGATNLTVQKTGYLYVFVSNESDMAVFFDNLVINHKTGPLLEVNNYRGFGSDIASQSARAFTANENKYKYNGKELQSKEWSDGTGLEQYDYGARHYDAWVGRWMVVDPLGETSRRWTVYNYCYNNPMSFTDPDGMEAVGADGLTNEEWMASSRPGADPEMAKEIVKERNYQNLKDKVDGNEDESDKPVNAPFSYLEKVTTYVTINLEQKKSSNSGVAIAGAISTGLLADDVSGIGVVDDVAIPFVMLGGLIYDAFAAPKTVAVPITIPITTYRKVNAPLTYVTYTKYNPITKQVYVGRTSGYGTPESIVRIRDYGHKDKIGYLAAEVDHSRIATMSWMNRQSDPSYGMIRGREQLYINHLGGPNSIWCSNLINGIGPMNGNGLWYLQLGSTLGGFKYSKW